MEEELQTLMYIPRHPNILPIVALCQDFRVKEFGSSLEIEKITDDNTDKMALVMKQHEHKSLPKFVKQYHNGKKKIKDNA